MTWSPWCLPGLVAATIAVLSAARVAGDQPVLRALRALLIALAAWALGNALGPLTTDVDGRVMAARIAYSGANLVPPFWLWWVAAYTGRFERILPKFLPLLLASPLIAALLAWTSAWNDLIWISSELKEIDGRLLWVVRRGDWWYLQLAINYLQMGTGLLLLIVALARAPFGRAGIGMILLVSLIPIVPNLAYVLGVGSDLPRADLTPAAFALGVAWIAVVAGAPEKFLIPLSRARIIDSLRSAVFVLDRAGDLFHMNDAAARLTARVGDEDQTLIRRLHSAGTDGQDAEMTIADAASDEGLTLAVNQSRIRDRHGYRLGSVMVVRDRTSETLTRRRLERLLTALVDHTDMLETAAASKTRFLANTSHELRAPLGGIVGFSEVLKDGLAGDLDSGQLERCQLIHDQSRALLRHINSILDLEKIEAGALVLRPEPVDALVLAETAYGTLRREAENAGIRLTFQYPDAGRTVRLDPGKVRQVLTSLCAHAIATSPPTSEIRVAVTATEDELRLFIRQRGEGVVLPSRRALTEPFWSTPTTGDGRASEVSGAAHLDLPLVQRLVTLHNGRLDVAQVGTDEIRFEVVLPAQVAE
ncbi:MAG TPA: histidine kinase N-terminal 7TM domain-containing protein [Pseudomonadales bacterium]|nr:histidine kinase N-terminal 7TM domain-containing protein [Pseudomonadales bacterium]